MAKYQQNNLPSQYFSLSVLQTMELLVCIQSEVVISNTIFCFSAVPLSSAVENTPVFFSYVVMSEKLGQWNEKVAGCDM